MHAPPHTKQALLILACYLLAGHLHQLGSVFIPNPLAAKGGVVQGWDVEVPLLAKGVHVRIYGFWWGWN
jgi:hypothetical protein